MMAVAVFMTSCEQEELSSIEAHENLVLNEGESIDALFKIAEILSKSVQSNESILPGLEDFCLESERKGHSDVEFFYHLKKDASLQRSSNTLAEIIESSEQFRSNETTELCNIPGLAFLLEGKLDSKKYSKRIYVDDGFDDSDPNTHIKYYENGVLGSHPISEVPDAKAFVVRISEAYISTGSYRYDLHKSMPNTLREIGKTNCGKSITIIDRKLEPVDLQSTDEDETRGIQTCDRDLTINKTENIKKFRTTSTYEFWRGKGEFFWLIIFADNVNYQLVNGGVQVNGNPLGYLNTGTYGNVKKDTWYYPNFSSIIWNLDNDGNRMWYVAYESDGGSATTFNLNLSVGFDPPGLGSASISASIPITINNGDDYVGSSIVEYCHDIDQNSSNPGFQYNYGAAEMYINNR